MEIEVNGIKYRQKPQKKTPKPIFQFMMMFAMFGGLPGIKEPKRPDVDIVTEYGLIQQKKSRLSRSQRDWVVWQFEQQFEKVSIFQTSDKVIVFNNREWMKTKDLPEGNDKYYQKATVLSVEKDKYGEWLADVLFDDGIESKGHFQSGIKKQ